MFSGGVCSWAAAKRVVAQNGLDGVVLLFADTKMEDEDLYRFIEEAAVNVGAPLVKIADGRNPWEIFEDVKAIGSTRMDPCSRILKRELLDRWVRDNAPTATIHFGLDWTELHRLDRLRDRKAPQKIEAYMTEAPFMDKPQMIDWLRAEGIEPPKLYKLGFSHNNCGGFCVKSGQAQFELLLRTMPERYAFHESQEARLRDKLNWRQTILRDQKDGKTKSLSLTEFRQLIENQPEMFDRHDWGGCGCAAE